MARSSYVKRRLAEIRSGVERPKPPRRRYHRDRPVTFVPNIDTVRPVDEASRAALAYVRKLRAGTDREASWFDVAKAYYDGATLTVTAVGVSK